MQRQYFEDFSETLSPEEYQRYLVFRRKREQGGRDMYRSRDWVGRDVVPESKDIMRTLEKLREADARLTRRLAEKAKQKRITNNERNETMKTNETYTTAELAEKLGTTTKSVGAFQRTGKIPKSAVVSEGKYRKSDIDGLIANGALRPANKPVTSGGKAKSLPSANDKASEMKPPTKPPVCPEIDLESYASAFWQSHEALAARVLTSPEKTRSFVLECVDAVLKFHSAK